MNWDVICWALHDFTMLRVTRGAFNGASTLLLMGAHAPDLPGVIYVTRGGRSETRFRFSLIVSIGESAVESENRIELADAPIEEVFNALAAVKDYLDTLGGVLANLDTDQAILDAAGMYLPNNLKLNLGRTDAADATTVKDNTTASGTASDLRLPESNNVNANSVTVYGDLTGKILVVNAKRQGTQFGLSPNSTADWRPSGLSDSDFVFEADDGSLHGIIDRVDTTNQKIIWSGLPICKITDAEGNLLYFKLNRDSNTLLPAIFDQLDKFSSYTVI